MNNRGQIDLSEVHPLAIVFGLLGALIGIYMVKVAGGGGLSFGDAKVGLGLFWKVLIPIACGAGGFFITNRMFQ